MDSNPNQKNGYVLGADIARFGRDFSVYVVIEEDWQSGQLRVRYIEEQHHKALTDAIGRIQVLDSKFHFRQILVDETGLGAGVSDVLKEKIGGRVTGVVFTIQSKEDMYSVLRVLLEQGRLRIPNHRKLVYQLRDLRYKVTELGHVKISAPEGGFDDYPSALCLAAYHFKPRQRHAFYVG